MRYPLPSPPPSSLPFHPCGASRTRGEESRIPRRYVAWIVLAAATARRTFRHAVTRVSSCPRNERAFPVIPLPPMLSSCLSLSFSFSLSQSPRPFLFLTLSLARRLLALPLRPPSLGRPFRLPRLPRIPPPSPLALFYLDPFPRFRTRRAELRSEWIYSRER